MTKWHVTTGLLHKDGAAVRFVPTPNTSGRITPTGIVYHDTAGRLNKGSSVSWLVQKKARASAHLVIERDGSVTQLARFDRATWHAGKSKHKGRSGCNRFMLGIEIVNPGKLASNGAAWFGEKFAPTTFAETKLHGRGRWYDYTPEQIEALEGITAALIKAYPTISNATDLVRHCDVSPGRKVDANPLFPIEAMRRAGFRVTDSETIDETRETAGTWPLRMGSRGKEVRAAQAVLKDLGYEPGPVDGIFGTLSRRAVRAWEDENDAINDGELSRDEFKTLTDEPSNEMPVAPLTALKQETAKAAGDKIKATVAGGTSLTIFTLLAGEGLWQTVAAALEELVSVRGHLKSLDMPIAPKVVGVVVIITVGLALYRWANQAQGDGK